MILLVSTFRALVFICHGVAEHCRAYDKVAKALTEKGIFVFSHDHGIVPLMIESDKLHTHTLLDIFVPNIRILKMMTLS